MAEYSFKRGVSGLQLHHHVHLDYAVRGSVNAVASVRAAARLTNDPKLWALADELEAVAHRVADARDAAKRRFDELYIEDPERFRRCRDGYEPWPDEAPGLIPRCNCRDRCLHEHGIDPGERGVCNCPGSKPPCPQHG